MLRAGWDWETYDAQPEWVVDAIRERMIEEARPQKSVPRARR